MCAGPVSNCLECVKQWNYSQAMVVPDSGVDTSPDWSFSEMVSSVLGSHLRVVGSPVLNW